MTVDSENQCIVCQSEAHQEAIRIHDHLVSRKVFVVDQCNHCGFRWIINPPKEVEAYKYYETEEYVEHSDSSDGLINLIYHKARKWMLRYKHNLVNNLGRGKKILDFGTGTGYFLNYMKSRGFDVRGIEISDKARSFGQINFDLQIHHPNDIFDEGFPKGYNYVSFWHVLEHVYEPDRVLRRLKDLLADDGAIIVALPNYKCLEAHIYDEYWNGYDVPRHLWHWDKESFTKFARKCGYKVTKTKILPLDPFYNCLISESYRKKKWAHILIPFIGFASLVQGWMKTDKASSIVYFLEKKS